MGKPSDAGERPHPGLLQKRHPNMIQWNALFSTGFQLGNRDVHGGGAFFPLLYVKGDPVAFIQRLETGAIDP